MVGDATSGRDRPRLLSSRGRRPDPPVGGGARRAHQPVLGPHVAELQRTDERIPELGVYGDDSRPRPLPQRTLSDGSSPSSDRSRAPSARASDTRSPARHSIRNSSPALGFGAALMRATTS